MYATIEADMPVDTNTPGYASLRYETRLTKFKLHRKLTSRELVPADFTAAV